MSPTSETLTVALGHHQAGRLQLAEQLYRQILEEDPRQADAIHLLGVIARQVGMQDVAIELIRQAIQLNDQVADYHNNLGGSYLDLKRLPEAIDCFRRAVKLNPIEPIAYGNLGKALCSQGNLEEAISCFFRRMELLPDSPEAHFDLANALKDFGKPSEAITIYRQALLLKPDFATAYNNLGIVLHSQNKLEEAYACYARTLELLPASFETHNNLGNLLMSLGRLEDAAESYRRALELEPRYSQAWNNLGNTYSAMGNIDEALSCFRKVRQLKPDDAVAHSNLLSTMQYSDSITLASLFDAHADFDRQHAAPLWPFTCPAVVQRDRLRVGFVSPDFGRHPVAFFLLGQFEQLTQHAIDTFCYSDRQRKDEFTERFQSAATKWRDVTGLSDTQLADQIRTDGIDILFDLTGHSAFNRLLVFVRKPAPIQITWIGYEGTTGISTMDYLIADRFMVPSASEHFYREKVIRMPDAYLSYDPPAMAPPVAPLPLLTKGYPTFGSFNNLAKLTPRVIEVWTTILQRLPTSRLVLKYRGLSDPRIRQKYLDAFQKHEIASTRIDLLPPTTFEDNLAAYHQLDLALDPFPFNGGATTCEALWMGVPVVTCPGETFASRHSLSYLSTIGLTECVAADTNNYIERAVSLASDPSRLSELRTSLRDRMSTSPLCNSKQFAANLAKMLHDLNKGRQE